MSNARTKRLNESQNPVTNYGIADDFHKLIIPKNTTTNLAQITPEDQASLAYDTTLNALVINNGSGFVAAGSGVPSVNGISNAVTIVAGANITVTPSGSNITIAASSATARMIVGDDTLLTTDQNIILNNNTGGTFNLNLPPGVNGQFYSFGAASANTSSFTLVPNGSDNIDFGGALAAPTAIVFISATSTWYATV